MTCLCCGAGYRACVSCSSCLQDFNVLRYGPRQHYNSHMDTFDPAYLAHSNPAFGQRMATFLMYLSDVEEGGETVFKHEGRYGECQGLPKD